MPEPVVSPNPATGPDITYSFTLVRVERQAWEMFYRSSEDQNVWRRHSFHVYGRGGYARAEQKIRHRLAEALEVGPNTIQLSFSEQNANRAYYRGTATAHCNHTNGVDRDGFCRARCGLAITMAQCPDCGVDTTYLDANGGLRDSRLGGYQHSCPARRQRLAEEREEADRQRFRERLAQQQEQLARRRNSPDFLCQNGTGEIR